MSQPREQQASDPILAAIHDVLKAEQSGETVLAEARQRAETERRGALERAQAIVERVHGRVSRLQQAYLAKIDRQIAASSWTGPGPSRAPPDLVAIVRTVAAKLTSDVDAVAK